MFLFFVQMLFFMATAIPILLMLRRSNLEIMNDPKKMRITIIGFILVLMLTIIPLVSVSQLNKMRLQEYIKDLESRGLTVIRIDHYFGGKTNLRYFENYTEFVELVETYGKAIYISVGAPDYHFLLVPRTIEMWFYPPDAHVSGIRID